MTVPILLVVIVVDELNPDPVAVPEPKEYQLITGATIPTPERVMLVPVSEISVKLSQAVELPPINTIGFWVIVTTKELAEISEQTPLPFDLIENDKKFLLKSALAGMYLTELLVLLSTKLDQLLVVFVPEVDHTIPDVPEKVAFNCI